MKSPFTGGIAIRRKEPRSLEFRKDNFEIMYHYFVCEDTAEQFTTTEIDILNQNQVYNKYREKYGIPFMDEIKEIRSKYGLSAAKMSDVLGFGPNVYRQYEAGEMPSVASGRFIRLASDPDEFRKLIEMSKNSFEPHEYEKVLRKMESMKAGWEEIEDIWEAWLTGNHYPNIHNGYRKPSLERGGCMVNFFADHNKPFTTGMNKLMFYADFCHFKNYGQSISGLYYKAIQNGPVPENYGGIYNHIVNKGFAKIVEMDFGDFVGEQFICENPEYMTEVRCHLSDTELSVLEKVSRRFLGLTTKKIVDISHEEAAWKENVDDRDRINFEYSFELKNIE